MRPVRALSGAHYLNRDCRDKTFSDEEKQTANFAASDIVARSVFA
jgi:hypothetical protein